MNGGDLSPRTGTNDRINKLMPMIARMFKGKPGISKFISAIVIVKKRTAMISGL